MAALFCLIVLNGRMVSLLVVLFGKIRNKRKNDAIIPERTQ